MVARLLAIKQSRKPHTRLGYETAWRLRIEPRFASMPVRRIKPSHVDDWSPT
jgi:hypothetical protein